MDITTVRDIPSNYTFIDLSQDVDSLKDHLGKEADEYSSFFVLVGDGDYDAIYGMYGTVPHLNKTVYKIL